MPVGHDSVVGTNECTAIYNNYELCRPNYVFHSLTYCICFFSPLFRTFYFLYFIFSSLALSLSSSFLHFSMRNGFSCLIIFLSLLVLPLGSLASCDVQVTMTDSFGDGNWGSGSVAGNAFAPGNFGTGYASPVFLASAPPFTVEYQSDFWPYETKVTTLVNGVPACVDVQLTTNSVSEMVCDFTAYCNSGNGTCSIALALGSEISNNSAVATLFSVNASGVPLEIGHQGPVLPIQPVVIGPWNVTTTPNYWLNVTHTGNLWYAVLFDGRAIPNYCKGRSTAGRITCDLSLICGSDLSARRTCGNAWVDPGEECDSGGLPGCSDECQVGRPIFACSLTHPLYSISLCTPFCGNGVSEPNVGEYCDDGNVVDGDGCSSQCTSEPGAVCHINSTTRGSVCSFTCGNGVLDAYETCDDGNSLGGDGCSPTCEIERGFECSPLGKNCSSACGDGQISSVETCDTGSDSYEGSGCLDNCTVATNYICTGEPSACVKRPMWTEDDYLRRPRQGTVHDGHRGDVIQDFTWRGPTLWTHSVLDLFPDISSSNKLVRSGAVHVGDVLIYEFGLIDVPSWYGNTVSARFAIVTLDASSGHRLWSHQAGTRERYSVYSPPLSAPSVGADGTVYLAARDGTLTALDVETGNILWNVTVSFNDGSSNAIVPKALVVDDLVMVATNRRLVAYSMAGLLEWRSNEMTSGDIIVAPVILMRGKVAVASGSDIVFVSTRTGDTIEIFRATTGFGAVYNFIRTGHGFLASYLARIVRFDHNDAVLSTTSSPSGNQFYSSSGATYFPQKIRLLSPDGSDLLFSIANVVFSSSFQVIRLVDGVELWSLQVDGEPIIHESGHVLACHATCRLYDINSGRLIKVFTTNGHVSGPLSVSGEGVIYFSPNLQGSDISAGLFATPLRLQPQVVPLASTGSMIAVLGIPPTLISAANWTCVSLGAFVEPARVTPSSIHCTVPSPRDARAVSIPISIRSHANSGSQSSYHGHEYSFSVPVVGLAPEIENVDIGRDAAVVIRGYHIGRGAQCFVSRHPVMASDIASHGVFNVPGLIRISTKSESAPLSYKAKEVSRLECSFHASPYHAHDLVGGGPLFFCVANDAFSIGCFSDALILNLESVGVPSAVRDFSAFSSKTIPHGRSWSDSVCWSRLSPGAQSIWRKGNNPTMITSTRDGRVIAGATGSIACFDCSGKRLWQQRFDTALTNLDRITIDENPGTTEEIILTEIRVDTNASHGHSQALAYSPIGDLLWNFSTTLPFSQGLLATGSWPDMIVGNGVVVTTVPFNDSTLSQQTSVNATVLSQQGAVLSQRTYRNMTLAATPVVFGDSILFATERTPGQLNISAVSFTLSDRWWSVLPQTDEGSTNTGSVVSIVIDHNRGRLFVALQFTIYAIEGSSGDVLWSTVLSSAIASAGLVGDRLVVTSQGLIRIMEPKWGTNSTLFSMSIQVAGSANPLVGLGEDSIVIATGARELDLYDANGSLLRSYIASNDDVSVVFSSQPTILSDGTIVAVDSRGNYHAVSPHPAPFYRVHLDQSIPEAQRPGVRFSTQPMVVLLSEGDFSDHSPLPQGLAVRVTVTSCAGPACAVAPGDLSGEVATSSSSPVVSFTDLSLQGGFGNTYTITFTAVTTDRCAILADDPFSSVF